MKIKQRLFYFSYELIDLIVFLLLWASLWYIYDYLIEKYIDINDKDKIFTVNLSVFITGIILLGIKHILIQSPYFS